MGTPNRVASGSARRNILAQQSMQHFKKQIGGQQDQYKKTTPKSRNNGPVGINTQIVPSSGGIG